MKLLDLFRPTPPQQDEDVGSLRFSAPDPHAGTRRVTLAFGDPCAAVSLMPRSASGKLGRSLRLVLGRTANERLPTDLRSLLKRLP